MTLLTAILIGIIVGGVAGMMLLENFDSLLINLILGITGSTIALIIYTLSGPGITNAGFITLGGALSSIIGASLMVLVYVGFRKKAASSN